MQKAHSIKRFLFLSIIMAGVFSSSHVFARESPYWHQRASLFERLPTSFKDIILLGDSITDGGEWHELLKNPHIKNRGISGDTSAGLLKRLDHIIDGKPRKLFILIGVNDLSRSISPNAVSHNIEKIIKKTQAKSPRTTIYIQSVLPVFTKYRAHSRLNPLIVQLNKLLLQIAKNQDVEYIDLHKSFIKSKKQLSNDGVHLTAEGYLLWSKLIREKTLSK